MKKIRIYLRVAKTSRGFRVKATTTPNQHPITRSSYYGNEPYPTIYQAIDLIVPDNAFNLSKDALEVKLKEIKPAADIELVEGE